MFFIMSKIVGFVLNPLVILLLLLTAIMITSAWKNRAKRKRQRPARITHHVMVTAFIIWTANLMMPIIPYLAVSSLEERFPLPAASTINPDVIVVLGGWQGAPSTYRGEVIPPISGSGDRLITGLILARQYPSALVTFPGGLKRRGASYGEDDISSAVINGLGLDPSRFVIEGASRNTAENAAFLKDLLSQRGVGEDGQILLITSAWHMPRAMGSFRAAGLDPIAFPTDFRTNTNGIDMSNLFMKGINITNIALHEYIGLLGYWVTGRTDHLLPRP